MQIVIEIPKKTYNEIKERTIVNCGEIFAKNLVRRIRNGTPLPKHHGRLIDADELMKEVVFISNEDESYSFVYAENIADAPTIIEEGDSE